VEHQIKSPSHRAGLRPDPVLSVSEWADKNRILVSLTSAEPGAYRTSRVPFLREIQDCLSIKSDIEEVVLMKPTQIGATELANNFIGYIADQCPAPVMFVSPTSTLAKRVSKTRITPMIDACPTLKHKFYAEKSRSKSNTTLMKDFINGVLVMAGANSASDLRNMPVRFLILDEVDAYPPDLDGEGDPSEIAKKRTDTFSRNRKIFKNSSPTNESESAIEEEYLDSDQRKYHIPCPHCDTYQVLYWRGLKWKIDENGEPENVHYECEACHGEISEGKKTWFLEHGKWVADAPFNGKKAGFWLNALYSPAGWFSWTQAIRDFLSANKAFKRTKSVKKLKVFTNTVLAETWKEKGVVVEYRNLHKRREHYDALAPTGVGIITAGIDVQDDRIEGEVYGWSLGGDEEKWSLDYFILNGCPEKQLIWDLLKERLKEVYRTKEGVDLRITASGLDTGGHYTQQAYKFARENKAMRIYAMKGSSRRNAPIAPRPSKVGLHKQDLYLIGTDTAKDIIYARSEIADPGAGCHHFPINEQYQEEYFRQFAAEERVTKYTNGFPYQIYVKKYQRNEPLDCNVYGYAALLILNPGYTVLKKKHDLKLENATENKQESKPDQENNQAIKKKQPKKSTRKRRGGFVNKYSR